MNSALSTRHSRNRHLRSALMASVMLLAASVPVAVSAQSDGGEQSRGDDIQFNIAAQGLDSALTSIADQGGIRIFFTSEELAGVQTSGVSGPMSVEQALSQALNGTGFGWRYREAGAIVIEPVPQSRGAIQLGPVRVEAASGGGRASGGVGQISAGEDGIDASSNYRSAQSQAYLSDVQIQQKRGTSTGDFLRGIPGVLNGDNRNSSALDVNIRGLQGMDRVPVVVDGSLQQSTVYRGYSGVAGRTYLDPDLIGSLSIEKGPSAAADGVGAIGGVVRAKTISVDNLIAPDGDFGIRVKTGLQGNNVTPPTPGTHGTGNGSEDRFDRPNDLDLGGHNISVAVAKRFENFDIVAAFAKRKIGNYFGGTDGVVPEASRYSDDGLLALGRFNLGEEVLNTSQDNTSILLRSIIRPNDDMALDISYIRYESDYGEMMPSQIIRFGGATQAILDRTEVDTYTARFRWQPEDNPLLDLRADLWLTQNYSRINTPYRFTLPSGEINAYAIWFLSQSNRLGARLWNTSQLDTPAGDLELSYGGSYTHQKLKAPKGWEDYFDEGEEYDGREGWRKEYSAYIAGELKPVDWVTLNASLRYTNTESHDENLTILYNYDTEGYNHNKTSGVSPIVSFLAEPFAGVQFYGRYAQAIRTPSLFESTTGWSFTPDIRNPPRPERTKMTEFGVNVQQASLLTGGDVLQAKVAYFNNDIDDYLTRGVSDGVVSVTNIERARFQGVEASLNYDAGVVFANLSGTFYTYTEFCGPNNLCRSSNTPNSYVVSHLTPKISGTVDAGVRLFDERLTLGGRYNHVGERDQPIISWGGTISAIDWQPYDLFDLYGSFDVSDNFQVDFGVDNISDQYYMDALTLGLMPSPGRTFRVGFTGKLGGPKGSDSSSYRAGVADAIEAKFGMPEFDGDWSGPFVGIQSGYGLIHTKGVTTPADGSANEIAATESANSHVNDSWYGLYAGYNFDLGNSLVVGFDGSLSFSQAKKRQYAESTELYQLYSCRDEEDDPCDLINQADTEYRYGWMTTARARLGYSTGRFLFYGAAGLAMLREEQERTQYIDKYAVKNLTADRPYGGAGSDVYFSETAKATRLGWTAGGGVEVAIGNNWSVKGEYNYSRFANKAFAFDEARAGVGKTFTADVITDYGDPVTFNFPFPPYSFTYYPNAVTEELTFDGSSETVNGRSANNSVEMHSVKIGVALRF